MIRYYPNTSRYVTLRRVPKGWSAKGLLAPLWNRYEGGEPEMPRREALAFAVGTTPSVLSAINSGKRNLGMDLGPRLAVELGVSLVELGGPALSGDERGASLVARIEALEAGLAQVQGGTPPGEVGATGDQVGSRPLQDVQPQLDPSAA